MSKVNPKPESWIADELAKREAQHLLRATPVYDQAGGTYETSDGRWLNLASNDYLNLSRHPSLIEAALHATRAHGTGSTASRLVVGTLPIHDALEKQIATHKAYPAALVFGSGFLANAGVIPALVGRTDHVFADRLVHASMIDAIQCSGARLHRFAHNDPAALDAQLDAVMSGRRLVLVESVYSMDGDLAPLAELAEVVRKHQVIWMVDEAHAGGIFGPCGAGRVAELGLQEDVTLAMGTLSKAYGGYGGYVACSEPLRTWLVNKARAFIYTTAPPPGVMAAAKAALDEVHAHPDMGRDLLQRAAFFRNQLRAHGLDTLNSQSQIVPVHIGDNETVLRIAQRLRAQRIIVGAMRPPTVPPGSARLRCSITLAHQESDLTLAANAIQQAVHAELSS